MKVLVLADALKAGGGITIYNQFLEHLQLQNDSNEYVIIVNPIISKPSIRNVRYIDVGALSKIQRLLSYNKVLSSRLDEIRFRPDVVISLQNSGLKPLKNVRQLIYYHQPMPLYPGRWNPFIKRERDLFIYKYIYPFFIKKTWGNNSDFIVQIPYIKKRMIARFGIDENRIHICFPDIERIDPNKIKPIYFDGVSNHFLYVVAGGLSTYKNISTLIHAAKILKDKRQEYSKGIVIHLTTTAEYVKPYYDLVMKLGVDDIIKFDGRYSHDELLMYYQGASGLLFPSSIETLGLPLLEAAAFGLPIVAADKVYAREVLNDYEGVRFVDVSNFEKWASEIIRISENNLRYKPLSQERKSSWNEFFKLINK